MSALAEKHGVPASVLASPLSVDLIESYDYMQSQREGLVEVMTKHLPNPMPPADASRMMVRRRRLEVDRGGVFCVCGGGGWMSGRWRAGRLAGQGF